MKKLKLEIQSLQNGNQGLQKQLAKTLLKLRSVANSQKRKTVRDTEIHNSVGRYLLCVCLCVYICAF